MSASDSVTFSPDRDGNEVWKASFSSSESIRGFAVLFRQLYSKDEDGSYFVTQGIVSKAHRLVHDESSDRRDDILRPWRAAHGKLLQQRIEAIVGRMAANSYAGTTSPAPVPFEDLRPTELISRYLYGDLIHWGEKRSELAALGQDQVLVDLDKFHFLEAMIGLAHYYLGFSILAGKAIDLRDDTGIRESVVPT